MLKEHGIIFRYGVQLFIHLIQRISKDSHQVSNHKDI